MIGRCSLVLLGGVVFAAACGRTEPQSTSSIAQVRQTAYLKASNPDMGDHFACGGSLPGHIGNAVAVSADGNTVAVGAPHESSAALGINGNAADNSLYNAGAVYVFVRRDDAWVQQAYVKASNAGQSDLFGMNVALSADRKSFYLTTSESSPFNVQLYRMAAAGGPRELLTPRPGAHQVVLFF